MITELLSVVPLFNYEILPHNYVDQDLLETALDNGYSITEIRRNKIQLIDNLKLINEIDIDNNENLTSDENKIIFNFMKKFYNSKYIHQNERTIITCMLYDYLFSIHE